MHVCRLCIRVYRDNAYLWRRTPLCANKRVVFCERMRSVECRDMYTLRHACDAYPCSPITASTRIGSVCIASNCPHQNRNHPKRTFTQNPQHNAFTPPSFHFTQNPSAQKRPPHASLTVPENAPFATCHDLPSSHTLVPTRAARNNSPFPSVSTRPRRPPPRHHRNASHNPFRPSSLPFHLLRPPLSPVPPAQTPPHMYATCRHTYTSSRSPRRTACPHRLAFVACPRLARPQSRGCASSHSCFMYVCQVG